MGRICFGIDRFVIDGILERGIARSAQIGSRIIRLIQTGVVADYAFTMAIGLLAFLAYWIHFRTP